MGYTDEQMVGFSQIGYDTTIQQKYPALKDKYPDGKVPMSAFYSPEEIKSKAVDFHMTEEQFSKWTIAGVHDTNSVDGFYCCIIDTGGGNAVVAFRGSESLDNPNALATDWGAADVGLLNSTMTTQHYQTERFLEQNKELLDKYNLTFTGHSLGGNLAEYACIVSGKYGLDDNVERCMSLDGPGFSDEFIKKHWNDIKHMSSKMQHRRWSFVGSMLFDLPGVDYEYIKVKDEYRYKHFTRHDTRSIDYGDGGSFQTGDQYRDGGSRVSSFISKTVDFVTDFSPAHFYYTLISTVEWAYESGLISGETADEIRLFLEEMHEFMEPIEAALATVKYLIIVTLAKGAEFVIEELINTVKAIGAVLKTAWDWTVQQFKEFVALCSKIIGDICELAKRAFNAGYRYASDHTEIIVDTAKLRSYADRLYGVNQRLINLDDRMGALYNELCLLDQFALQRADMSVGSNKFITRSAEYLNSAADLFESAENEICGKL